MKTLYVFLFIAATFLGSRQFAQANGGRDVAFVYRGPGSCDVGTVDGCAEVLAKLAQNAGFTPVFVGPSGAEASGLWDRAAIWIQPGGRAKAQVLAMTSDLKQKIRDFVQGGGGYVGFCAGGFLATEQFGWQGDPDPKNNFESAALGLLPGYSRYYDRFDTEITDKRPAKVIPTVWLGEATSIYWELGPYFDATSLQPGVEVVSRYADGLVMSLRSTFGNGRVFVTGVHPEAPMSWFTYYNLADPDGLQNQRAIGMMHWVAP